MTGQAPDQIILNGEIFSLIGLKGQNQFRPEDFGMDPYSATTACWRGYIMGYIISDNQLFLDEMQVCADNAPEINGIKPQSGNHFFKYHYTELKLKSNFTGSLLLAKDFINSMYVHMGFQRPIAFETVIEISFKNGEVILEIDISKQIEEYRNIDANNGARPHSDSMKDIGKWVEKTFSLEYDFE